MTLPALTFDVTSLIVVVGTNPEMADVTNPRGELYGLSFAVRAVNERGDTWEKHVATGSPWQEKELEAQAKKVAEALQVRLDRLGRLPVGFAQWSPGRAVYGSQAWEEYGNDEEMALERREAEEEGWR